MDFYQSVKYIHSNADMLGVDKNKICASGTSGGSWICLGATYHMIKANEANMIKSLFLICPMISDQTGSLTENQLKPYEKSNALSISNFFHHLMTDEDRKIKGAAMYPGLMDLEDLKKCPPTVVFTSEFDFLRRDALNFVDRLKQVGKYLDH